MPIGIRVQTDGELAVAGVQLYAFSIWQSDEQPSPLYVLLSSHYSRGFGLPLPQKLL